MEKLIEALCGILEHGEGAVLATILTHAGSTPRSAGTRMIVRSDGTIFGTIGGGLLEAEVMREAGECFRQRDARIRSFDLHAQQEGALDMLCGGAVEVLLEYIEPSDVHRALFREMANALTGRRGCALVTDLGPEGGQPGAARLCLVCGGTCVCGHFPHPASWLTELTRSVSGAGASALVSLEGRRFLVEPCYVPDTLYLFGAGHVSRQVAALATRVGFQTVVLDDRSEFANADRFPGAARIVLLASFEQALADLDIDGNSYLVILTRGHSHDKTVLQQALRTPFGYLGMIGSRRKRDAIYEVLVREGFLREELERVHCPVGLKIGAESPEEIAVSIVAELILERAEAKKP